MALTSLAIGTLLSDAMLHILPEVNWACNESLEAKFFFQVLGVEKDDEGDPDVITVPDFAIKICGALFGKIFFPWLIFARI